MKEKTIVLQQYCKYLQAIKECNVEQVPSMFKTFMTFLDNNTKNEEFYSIVAFNAIGGTLGVTEQKGLNYKSASTNWNSKIVARGMHLIDELKKAYGDALGTIYTNEQERFGIVFGNYIKTVDSADDPCIQLFLYSVYNRATKGDKPLPRIFSYQAMTLNKMLGASSDEEIESILSSLQEPQEETNTASPTQTTHEPREKTELFKLFNPKDLAETEACFAMAEEMFSKGELCKDDYSYVKEILLLPRRVFYKNGGTYKEPTKDSPFKKALNDDSNDELSEALAPS